MDTKIKQELIEHDHEDDDPVVQEIEVFLSKSLENKIYLLQYPIRPQDRTYDDSIFLSAKIKPKINKVELEIGLDTRNDNYSKEKGEQYALNVDGKQNVQTKSGSRIKQEPQVNYYRSNLMDKQVLCSTNATLGQMNRLYHLGLLKDNKLHLNPVQAILQMKPSFDYFDLVEKKNKDLKDSKEMNEPEIDIEEDLENELEKAELVTMKYSNHPHKGVSEPEQNWINLEYCDQNSLDSDQLKQNLYCKNQQNLVKQNIFFSSLKNKKFDINTQNLT
ncbi:DNA-directed RNA polymerase III subunit RPC5 isoform X2 [Brachionus plicatilis]|uniref:DNA-directed RNA polymerase III subunit RPC5 isoform X2 n=1 Tax=Brachionus plicatilis TaxID=10195 RepID=A0A3M7QGH1_BRAPC|nr:DNA-directed RNA polymerase III subunit RPC5 isoform X2 [Brachionus plicatilis]